MVWPEGFERVLSGEPWVEQPIGALALKYDSVESHGWYANLEPTLVALRKTLRDGDFVVDYSAGTGILIDRLFRANPDLRIAALLVDASPKFLRLAWEKLGDDERVALRWIRYLREEKRLQRLDEVLDQSLRQRGIDVLISTNAIHLYYGMEETLRSWTQTLRPGGIAFVQSGNIDNPDAPPGTWIIDQTVERIQPIARDLVRTDPRYAPFRDRLSDTGRCARYDALRAKYFLPVRPAHYYLDQLRAAGLEVLKVEALPIEAEVRNWFDFLSAYHEGVLGWAGGASKIEGEPAPEALIELRLALLRHALDRLFEGQARFEACWTYITCVNP